ncbi:MAG: MFS transporter [Vallitaleaceae bacterium]|nr:MFS transporter [Vallitaleaceae bacterium]
MFKKNNHNLYYYILYGMMYEFITRLYSPYQVKFLERIGGSSFDISLFNSLPGFVMALSLIPGLILLRSLDSKKVTEISLIISRLFVLAMFFIPFFPEQNRPFVFLMLIALTSAPQALYTNGFQSLTGDLFPSSETARALSLKSKYSVLIIVLVTFLTGYILTKFTHSNAKVLQVYQLFFLLAFTLTIFELQILRKMKPKPMDQPKEASLRDIFNEILHNQKYLLFVACSLVFHFGWQMGWPLFNIYTIDVLGAEEGWLSLSNNASMITMFIGYSLWGKLIQRYGNPIVMAICAIGMSITPFFYIISKDLNMLLIMTTLTGIFTSGTLTVLLSSALEVIPTKHRMFYMGFYTTLTNMSLMIAPIVGHYFHEHQGIVYALLMTAIFRFVGGAFFIGRNLIIKKELSH